MIALVESRWAPPDHPVFKLVAVDFSNRARECWQSIGSPLVDIDNVWDLFAQMVDIFRGIGINPTQDLILLSGTGDAEDNEEIELLPGLQCANIHTGLSIPLQPYMLELEKAEESTLPNEEEDSDDGSIISDIGGGLFVDFSDEEDITNGG